MKFGTSETTSEVGGFKDKRSDVDGLQDRRVKLMASRTGGILHVFLREATPHVVRNLLCGSGPALMMSGLCLAGSLR
jgi:hypothetical protein